MPLTACPECRHVSAVRQEQLGHRIRCPNCTQTFRAARVPFSFRRAFRPGHSGAATLATLLLILGLSLGSWLALSPNGPGNFGWNVSLNVAVALSVVGFILLTCHLQTLSHRPQPTSSRRPVMGMGTPGLEPGTRRL